MPVTQTQDNPSVGFEDNVSVTVNEGPVKIDSEDANYVEETRILYPDYHIRNRYEADGHRYMMGITSPTPFQGASVAFVQLASKTLLWICDWTALCEGSQPVVPDPTPNDSNWILLDEHWEPATLGQVPDGKTPVYRISGTYVYGHKNPDKSTFKNIVYGRPPWMEEVYARNQPSNKLQQGISSPVTTLVGGTVPG